MARRCPPVDHRARRSVTALAWSCRGRAEVPVPACHRRGSSCTISSRGSSAGNGRRAGILSATPAHARTVEGSCAHWARISPRCSSTCRATSRSSGTCARSSHAQAARGSCSPSRRVVRLRVASRVQGSSRTSWDSMCQRFMTRLLKDTEIKERFTEHDLRGKVGSDVVSVERASDLLGRASKEITKRHYRRKPEVIRPVR